MDITMNENNRHQAIESENVMTLRAAGFWVRFLAFIFDLGVIAMSSQIFFRLVWLSSLDTMPVKSFILINSFFPGIWGCLYFVLMTKYFGQTLGKMLMGIKVVSVDGHVLSWMAIFMREVVGRTISQLLGSYIGYLLCAFHPQKQGLTDLVADTYVVYVNGKEKSRPVQVQVAIG